MAVYIVTGKLGGGKTLCSVGLIRDALNQGRAVATNVDLNLEYLLPWKRKKVKAYRLPDKLSADSFKIIGSGNDTYDEDMNGLVVLDEGGLSMNSREYREAGRKEFIQWAIHSRKSGWDMAIVIQHIDGLDKQIRDFFGEHIVTCSRLDRVRIPLIGWVLQMFGFKAMLPKMHKATCRYGQGQSSVVTWRKWFKGADLYDAFDTRQKYDPFDTSGVCSLLSPWHVKGRHCHPSDEWKTYFKHIWERYLNVKLGRLPVFFCAALLGGWVNASFKDEQDLQPLAAVTNEPQPVIEEISEPIEKPFDPLEGAYINSSLGNVKTGQYKYWFRDLYGNKIDQKSTWTIRSIGSCRAHVITKDRSYSLTCEKPN